MSGLRVRHFTSEPVFRFSAQGPTLGAGQEEEVAQIWRAAATDLSRHLTDNEILHVTHFGDTIEVSRIPYRYFVAQSVRPELFPHPLTALAVSGILLCEDRFVLGRRADWVSQDPGALELVPSGSVDADLAAGGQVDVRAQLGREAAEELGVGDNALAGHRILGAIEDKENHVIDIAIQAILGCTFGQLLEAHSSLERREYSELHAVTAQELQRMIDDGTAPISAVSSAIFANFCAVPE